MKPSVKTDPPMIKTNRGQHRQPRSVHPANSISSCRSKNRWHMIAKKPESNLFVLDLTVPLVSRTGKRGGYRRMYVRPYHDEFLEYLFSAFYG
ncbi:hypothetical protein O0I10_004580 [Lichtheimia ornata]|uniref:FCP1 homology domain-containing protein n=1 Tax=Lichtheimia ornata TaxID=688661 RepID=A0AAD7Y069_9FUNG|nr:uncharacterized protein O0I10_004580 [Lichtheimia ornata]KAJ8659601.1 hypothetical protein O0I10_004580 [Lichtheimia ornata]